jgi:hypothetical protein
MSAPLEGLARASEERRKRVAGGRIARWLRRPGACFDVNVGHDCFSPTHPESVGRARQSGARAVGGLVSLMYEKRPRPPETGA